MKTTNTQRPVCKDCGGINISVDATAVWNYRKKDWDLSGVMDGGYCNDCDREQKFFDWVDIKGRRRKR